MRSLPIRRTTQSGFTLIELMIVVAVVGILSAVALPSYGEYTVRSRVAELAIMGASMKATVSENILNNGGTNLPGKDNCVGTTTSAQGTRNTRSVDCNPATGVITVSGTDAAANVVLTFAPRLTDAGAVSWQCLSAVEKFSVVPAECRVAS